MTIYPLVGNNLAPSAVFSLFVAFFATNATNGEWKKVKEHDVSILDLNFNLLHMKTFQ